MKQIYEIRTASKKDYSIINNILSASNLCPVESEELLKNFLIMTINEKIIGVIGLEIFGEDALLRSFAVVDEFREKGFGSKLYNKIMDIVPSKGVNRIFLLTETAQKYFESRGFETIERNSAPLKMLDSTEFKIFCPKSAVCMLKKV